MRHSDLLEKYDRGVMHFKKGNFRRAKWIFEQIVCELSESDTDSMGDIHLHNSAQDYLDEIYFKEENSSLKIPAIVTILIIAVIILYFILR